MGTYADNPYQDGDVLLYQSLDGGNMNSVDGVAEMTTNFDTMAYLTFQGGNVDDPGGDDKTKQWWGNFTEPDTAKHYRSEFQYLVDGLSASSSNLLLVEQAATRDAERAFIQTGIADKVTVTASIPKKGQVTLTVVIEAQGNRSEYTFTENWESTQ